MKPLIVIAAYLMAVPVWADSYSVSSGDVDPCAGLVQSLQQDYQHRPDADVNLNGFDFNKDKQVIRIPVEIESLQAFGLNAAVPPGVEAKPDLGVIELYPDGRLFYDGQEIQSQSLEALCRSGAVHYSDIIEGQQ